MKNTMKKLSILLLASLSLVGCATSGSQSGYSSSRSIRTTEVPMRAVSVPGTELPLPEESSVRYGEVVKAYEVGPYVDPADPKVRHDAHTVARVEQDAAWDLHPNKDVKAQRGPATMAVDPAMQSNPLTAEFEQELEKQKKYSATIISQNDAMSDRLEKLNREAEKYEKANEENAALKSALEENRKVLEQLRQEVTALAQASSPPPSLFERIFGRSQKNVPPTYAPIRENP
jgi:hypothetical protein